MSQPFAKAIDLLYLAKQNGVDVALNEDQLQLKLPKNRTIDKDLIEQLKNSKQQIIDFLKERQRSHSQFEKIARTQRDTLTHLPLSFSQERLWFIHQMEGSIQYHIPAVLRLQGKLNQEALSRAFQNIISRHEVLRTIFLEEDGQPFQLIRDWQEWNLERSDGSAYMDQQQSLQDHIQHLINQPFDLSKDYMVRANLIFLREDEHVLVVTMHHIASDGWSTSIIVKEIAELYAAYSEGRDARLFPLEIQYADYAVWQRNHLQGDVVKAKLEYWKNKLLNVAPLQLPADRLRPAVRTTGGAVVDFDIDKLVSEQLHTISQQQDVTLYMTLLAAFKVLLHNYSGQDDICVGSPIANRTHHEIEGLIGFFVNTLALRSELSDDVRFSEFLKQVKETTMDAFERQEIPFEKVVEKVVKERDLSRTPLFQVMFVLQNTPEVQRLRLGDMVLVNEQLPHQTSKFELTLFVVETSQGLQGAFEYATDLFTEATVKSIALHFKVLLESIVKTPHEKIGSLRMITDGEEQQVINGFNQTHAEYPATKSVIELFEVQAEKTPEATALIIGNDQLSYRALNEKANQLASYLRSKGVGQESLVPICIERSFLMIIGVLGILKTGAAYVPIDPEYPTERVRFMLDDSDAGVLLVSEHTHPVLKTPENVESIRLDYDLAVLNSQPSENLQVNIDPLGLVYVLYTSGSTGRPKGVKMAGSGMVNLLCWQQKQFGSEHRTVLQFASLNFDVSFQEIFSTLCFGNTLILINSETRREIPEMIRVLEKQEVTHLFIPFIVLKNLVEYISSIAETSFSLQSVIVAGEQLKLTNDIRQFITTHGIQLINQYGPTEAHVVTSYTVENTPVFNPLPPIGKPIDNTRIYILNPHHRALPVNVPGEIYIGGVQVARGYLNNETLTADKFLPDPFSKEKDARMYRTGDLGRWLADGNVEYLGRIDGQVKVRGYRIELGEIETVLQQHDGVRQAVVLARPDKNGHNRLIAYVTPEGNFDKQSIVQYLKERLPEFMVPSLWVEMEKLPVTPNGKVDRKALPEPDASDLLTNRYTAPRNETEARLAGIWRELLGVDQVGIQDNFFELGGHSLLAVRVISAIRKQLDLEITIKDIFTYTSVAELAAHLVQQSKGSLIPPLTAHTTRENVPLSFSQERLWFIDQLEGSVQYHLSTVLRLTGDLDVAALNNAFKNILDRHEVLRSVIYQEEGIPFIRVKENDFSLSIEERFFERRNTSELPGFISTLVNKPFDLSRDNMLRASLIRVTDNEQILVVTMHHIASDGWSVSILVKEVVELYDSYNQGRAPGLSSQPIQYSDYAIWQKNFLQGEILHKKLDYWRQKLSGVSPILLPADRPRPPLRSNRGGMLAFNVDKELTNKLQRLSSENGVTLFMTLLAAFKVLLHRYSDQEDICVGTPIAGRQQEQLESLIGFFINTLALRTEVSKDSSFTEVLKDVRKTTLEAYEHQELPFEKIVEAVVTERDRSRTPIFQVMFVFQNTPSIPDLRLGNVQLKAAEHPHTTTQFDISFIVTETANGLRGSVNYSTDLYDETTIERMVSHFRKLLHSVAIEPQQSVGLLPMLEKEEQQQLVNSFNDTNVDYPLHKDFINLFEEQVRSTPTATALIFQHRELTYEELNQRSNQLARYLRSKGAKEESVVAICMKRSPEMVIGILGVLKAGAAYVPIDPNYPRERRIYMLEDSGASLVIADGSDTAGLSIPGQVEIIEINVNSSISHQPTTDVTIERLPHHLAYVIYTSGSTGKPKGVMIEHRNVYAFLSWCRQEFSTSKFDIVYASTSICFDLSIFEIFYPLTVGKKIRILEDALQIEEYLEKDRFILVNTVPIVVDNLLNEGIDLRNISVLNMAGEPIPSSVVQRLDTNAIEVRNLYGPTEDTTYSTVFRLKKDLPVLIGRPISNTQVYIVDRNHGLVPIGVPGEICLGGSGVTRGYMHQPELTAAKFINNLFTPNATSKLYKTGDLGRWLPDGNIEYLGRIDQQVKIRGHRVEPGEIETVLHESGFVQQAVVLAKKDSTGVHRLVGYVVPKKEFDRSSIIAYLKQKLPQHMIPAAWVSLENLPLTPNGKINKKALPDPDADKPKNEYIAPRNETEQILATIWQQVLPVKRLSITDNFFEVGGHSLLAMRLISAVRRELNTDLSIKELFAYPTVKGLATLLNSRNNDITNPIVQTKERPKFIPLSFSQERLWFIDRLEGSAHYHMPAVFKLKGDLDAYALNYAFQQIVNRHEVLRTVIRHKEGEAYQVIMPSDGFRIGLVDGSIDDHAANLQATVRDLIQEAFDLATDYMLRATLIKVEEGGYTLVVNMHHIAADGWSIPILFKEVAELYNAFRERRAVRLPELQLQYADFAIWQRETLRGELFDNKLDYWKKSLTDLTPLHLPEDFPRPLVQSTRGAIRHIEIGKELTSKLQLVSQQCRATLFMTLLASFNVLLHRYSGQHSICVGTPIAGRQQQELEDLIGFFVNTLALRTEIHSETSFADILAYVKEITLNGYMHQDVPFEKVVEAVVKERDLSRNPLFQTMFILQDTSHTPNLQLGDVEVSFDGLKHTTSKFDITFIVTNTREGLILAVEYCVDLFRESTINRMMEHFRTLLQSIVNDPLQHVGKLTMLSPQEELRLLHELNATSVSYPKSKSIVELVEQQVKRTPDAPALIFGEKQLSYSELNAKANQLANYLRSKGVKPKNLVPVCVDRSLEMIISILAILKTGAAYVPIDPEYPQERIRFKLNDTVANMVICSRQAITKIESDFPIEIVDVETDWPAVSGQPIDNLNIQIHPDDLVYVIYTSGSTGRPKGVQMATAGLVNLLFWQEKQFRNKHRRVLQYASLNFDVSFQEIFSTLCFGSTLYLISEETRRDPAQVIRQLGVNGITHLFVPYIVLKSLAEYALAAGEVLQQLEEVIVAGEQLKVTEDIRTVLMKSNIELVNQYGPTEAHVVSSFKVDKAAISVLPPIGKPIDNTQLYILNQSKSLAPVGVLGEIYIGGVQVARGYLNSPQLTEEKFVIDPFSSEKNSRLYRTGDLGKWLPDGNIEYVGRIDDQVKIRGYRIELGEIESVLQQYEGIQQAVVVAREDVASNKRLIGFVVPKGNFDTEDIMSFLRQRLPDYMVPTQWVQMDNIPVTGNGKIDRNALVLPDAVPSTHVPVAPGNEVEERLLEIWRKLLGVQHISVKDNFFEVGGHSLLAMRLIAAIRRQLGVDLPLMDIYELDIQSLAAKIMSQQTIENIDAVGSTVDSGNSAESTEVMEMAQRIEKGVVEWGVNGHGKYLVPIKPTGTKNPFFGIISFKQYRLLGSLMSDDQPLFYLPPTRAASVEEIASHYINEMKLSHPGGPYTIGGFCGAGMIALEIAQQLQAQGDEVSALILFEYYAPESLLRKQSLKYKKRLLGRYKKRLISYKKSSVSSLDVFKFVMKRTYQGFRNLLHPPPPKFITSPKYNSYVHKPYSGKVILFQASIPPLEATNSPLMGWSKYFTGPVELITIQGGHLGIFRQPEIRKLAEELTLVLEELNNEQIAIQKSIS